MVIDKASWVITKLLMVVCLAWVELMVVFILLMSGAHMEPSESRLPVTISLGVSVVLWLYITMRLARRWGRRYRARFGASPLD